MKNLLLFAIVIVAMTGTSKAQGCTCPDTLCICAGDPAPPGDSNEMYRSCIQVACDSDPNNCGLVGNVCADYETCQSGKCQESPEICCMTADLLLIKRPEWPKPRWSFKPTLIKL